MTINPYDKHIDFYKRACVIILGKALSGPWLKGLEMRGQFYFFGISIFCSWKLSIHYL
jgi:hypothetical protein